MYRLDFVVASTGSGAPERHTYTMNVEDQNPAEMRVGANVLLTTQGNSRQDVGVMIRCNLKAQGEQLVMHVDTELSAKEADFSIRKIRLRGDALLTPGASASVASLDEPATRSHYDLTVTATRLN